jgi:hypothetical protein
MNGRTTLDVIAQQVQKKFPSRFKAPGESQFYVNALSREYGI